MQKLTYQDGWNGGHYNVDLEKVSKFALMHEGKLVEVAVKKFVEYGSDDDMGRTYHWKRTDANLILNAFGFGIEVPLMQFIERGLVYVEV